MATLAEVEKATKVYADRRELLALRVATLNDEIEELRRKAMPGIREAASHTANAKNALHDVIDGSRPLFAKPKSIIISGIRVGLKKATGKVEIEDDEAVVERIKKIFKPEEHGFYIKTTEKPIKDALKDLDEKTLKLLGVEAPDGEEVVVIKAVDTEVDKIVTAMLKESDKLEAAERMVA